jgi:5-methylcytosine-specific restriction endonuclease McrA
MAQETITVREQIAWSYANLARADKALQDGAKKYGRIHHMIRAKLNKGLREQTMSMTSLYQDERLKMTVPQACYYCGSTSKLSVDHLIPRIKGGADESDNLIWACRSCNSSKRDRDMMKWMLDRNSFPSIFLLRRYLKIVMRYCESNNLLDVKLAEALQQDLPFDLSILPHNFPPLTELKLWVYPCEQG